SGLREEEIKKMVDEATAHADEDQKKKALAEARNAADAKAYEVEKGIADHGAKLDESVKSSLQEKIKAAREAAKSDDVRRIESAADELARAWMQAAQTLYQQASPGPGGPGPGAEAGAGAGAGDGKKKGDGPVDADFEVVN